MKEPLLLEFADLNPRERMLHLDGFFAEITKNTEDYGKTQS